jgi:hypothetical protein
MNNSWLLDNETISVQLGNISTRIRQGDFVDFIGIQPNLAFTALEYGSREALLQTEGNCEMQHHRIRNILGEIREGSKTNANNAKPRESVNQSECYPVKPVGASSLSIPMVSCQKISAQPPAVK